LAIFLFKPSDYQPSNNPDDDDWPSYFHIPVVMLLLIMLCNYAAMIALANDAPGVSYQPESWDLNMLILQAIIFASVGCISSVVFLDLLLSSWRNNGLFQLLGLPGLSFGQIVTGVYLQLSLSQILTNFSLVNQTTTSFWKVQINPGVQRAIFIIFIIVNGLACLWPSSYMDKEYALGLFYRHPVYLPLLIWMYCYIWLFIQVESLFYFCSSLIYDDCDYYYYYYYDI
jgi:H+-transporting ATPase